MNIGFDSFYFNLMMIVINFIFILFIYKNTGIMNYEKIPKEKSMEEFFW